MKPNKLSEQNETKHLLETDNQSINQLLHENIENCAALWQKMIIIIIEYHT